MVTGGEFVATPHCVRGMRPQFVPAGRKVTNGGQGTGREGEMVEVEVVIKNH